MTPWRAGALAPLVAAAVIAAGTAVAGAEAPAWTSPKLVAPSGTLPEVGFDANGNAVAVWLDDGAVKASFRPAGETWSQPQQLAPAEAHARNLVLAVGDGGDAVAAWIAQASGAAIVTATRPPTRPFEPSRVLVTAYDVANPRVAVAPDGRSAVVWSRNGTFPSHVWAFVRSRKAGRAAPALVGRGDNPAVAFDGRGRATIAWTGDHEISIATAVTSTFGAARRVSVEDNLLSRSVALDVSPSGAYVAAFATSAGPPTYRYTLRAVVGGGSAAPNGAFLVDGNFSFENGFRAAIGDRGGALVVWTQGYGVEFRLVAARATPTGFGAPQTLCEDVAGYDVVVGRGGRAYAIWSRWAGDYVVQAATAEVGGAFGDPVDLSPHGYNAPDPEIDVDADGDAIAAWSRSFGSRTFIQAAGFDAAGPQLRDLLVPKRMRAGAQATFSVAPVDVWSSVASVRWEFGDGAVASDTRTTHAYRKPGKYRLTLTGTDSAGHSRTAARSVTVVR